MKIKNGEIELFIKFLMDLELKGKDSRMRTRFVRLLGERFALIQEEHQELINQYVEKDENGEPKIINRNGREVYDVKNLAEFNKEYAVLMNEDFVIEQNEERREMLMSVRDSVLNCDMAFKGQQAIEYDRWCEIVEQISYPEV